MPKKKSTLNKRRLSRERVARSIGKADNARSKMKKPFPKGVKVHSTRNMDNQRVNQYRKNRKAALSSAIKKVQRKK
jgi:hypothetical protein